MIKRIREQRIRVRTCLFLGTRVGGVRVPVVITEVFGDVVARQLSHNVGDVSIRAEVLQPLVSATSWRKRRTTLSTNLTAATATS